MRIVKVIIFAALIWSGTFYSSAQAESKVLWNGAELVKGQIGLLTIKKPINLWERKNNKLVFIKILKPTEKFRVYGFDKQHQQYKVGGSLVVTNIPNRVEYKTPSKQKLELLSRNIGMENEELVNKIVITQPSIQDKDEVRQIKKRISKLPLSLLEKLRQNNVTIFLVDEPITNFPEFSHLKGVTPRGWENSGKTWDDIPGAGGERRVIIRIGQNDYKNGHGSINLELHETAHTIDHIVYNNLSLSSEFQNIWKKESGNLFGSHSYYKNYQEEYFAEAFAMFYFDKDSKQQLKTFAPLTYTIFENSN
jgi:Pro-Pro endopeptidase